MNNASDSATTETGTNTLDGTAVDRGENNDKLSRSLAQMIDAFSQVNLQFICSKPNVAMK